MHTSLVTALSRCVFLDADTLVLQNVDELFDRPELSAAADAGWPDCFNSVWHLYFYLLPVLIQPAISYEDAIHLPLFDTSTSACVEINVQISQQG